MLINKNNKKQTYHNFIQIKEDDGKQEKGEAEILEKPESSSSSAESI